MFVHKNGLPFRPGMRPEAEFAGNGKVHLSRLFGWSLIVRSALFSINRTVFRKFHRHLAGDFALTIKKRGCRALR